ARTKAEPTNPPPPRMKNTPLEADPVGASLAVLAEPRCGGADPFLKRGRAIQSERMHALDVKDLDELSFGLGCIPIDLAFVPNNVLHKLGELLDRRRRPARYVHGTLTVVRLDEVREGG